MKNETIRIGQTTIDFLLEAADTNGSVAMFEFGVPAGAKVHFLIITNIMTKRFMG